jgi:hypothetical protein
LDYVHVYHSVHIGIIDNYCVYVPHAPCRLFGFVRDA